MRKSKKLSIQGLLKRIKMLEATNEVLSQGNARLLDMDRIRERLPIVDKEIFLRLLEVIYAAKGGMASWGRR